MRIQIAVPEAHVTKPVLDAALEGVTRLNEQLIKSGASPTASQLIAQGAIWKPEPPGQEHFDHGALIAERGEGDCDDWAPLKAAELRVTGEDPGAKAVVYKSGEKRWHAVVQRSDNSIDDPSLDAGMPGPGRRVGINGAWTPSMRRRVHGVGGTYINTPDLALRPIPDRHGQIESWQARADLPWHWWPQGQSPQDVAMVTLHRSPVADQAIVGAVLGALDLGCASGYADVEQLKRLDAVAAACEGVPWEDIAAEFGVEHANAAGGVVEGLFGGALKKLGKIAKGGLKFVTKNPLGKLAMSAIPGAGLATAAFNMASPALKKSVVKQQHMPPDKRGGALMPVAPAPGVAAPGGGAHSDLNVVLLSRFGDLLHRAYESGHRTAGAPRPRRAPSTTRPSSTRPSSTSSARRPGTAYPR